MKMTTGRVNHGYLEKLSINHTFVLVCPSLDKLRICLLNEISVSFWCADDDRMEWNSTMPSKMAVFISEPWKKLFV